MGKPVIGFIGVGLMVILAVFIAVKMSSVPSELDPFASIGAAKGLISFIYFAFALFYFFPVYF